MRETDLNRHFARRDREAVDVAHLDAYRRCGRHAVDIPAKFRRYAGGRPAPDWAVPARNLVRLPQSDTGMLVVVDEAIRRDPEAMRENFTLAQALTICANVTFDTSGFAHDAKELT